MKKILKKIINKYSPNNIRQGKVISVLTDANGSISGYTIQVGTIVKDVYTTDFTDLKVDDTIMVYVPDSNFSVAQILGKFNSVNVLSQTVIALDVG